MRVFNIEYVETVRGYFGVEAETEEDALERFREWRMNDDYVYDVMTNADNYRKTYKNGYKNPFLLFHDKLYHICITKPYRYQKLF